MTIFGLTLIEFLGWVYVGILSSNLATFFTGHPWWKRGPGKGGTAKQVQVAWNEAVGPAWDEAMGDEWPEEPEPEELYLGWAGTENYEEPHDCLLAGCLDNENEEPCPNA